MIKSAVGIVRVNWRPVLYAALVGFVVFMLVAICEADVFFFVNVFLIAPGLLAFSIVFLCYVVFSRKGRRQRWTILASFALLWTLAILVFFLNSAYPFALRETARWLAWSSEYKQEIMAQPITAGGDLKHLEWDGSGYAGVANNTVYLVFDPADALSAAAGKDDPGQVNGIPCKVRTIRRLESHWHSVLFYTDQIWGECK